MKKLITRTKKYRKGELIELNLKLLEASTSNVSNPYNKRN
jgi:hypothetical protein